jgi:uncharacterized protein with ATP-grasp and redox domains
MKTHPHCFPCFLNQVLRTAEILGFSRQDLLGLVKRACAILTGFNEAYPPPRNAVEIYDMISEAAGVADPFKKIKEESTRSALELLPRLEALVEEEGDGLGAAVRLAACGNVIDYGVGSTYDLQGELRQIMEVAFAAWDMDEFSALMEGADHVLYIGDNAGEAVFDIPLIKELRARGLDVIYAVRGGPIINDVTMDEAEASGISRLCRVISTGCRAPGIVFEWCNNEFLRLFDSAPLIISKGQGNFETLFRAERAAGRPIFFIFKVKCRVVSGFLGMPLGSMLFMKI